MYIIEESILKIYLNWDTQATSDNGARELVIPVESRKKIIINKAEV